MADEDGVRRLITAMYESISGPAGPRDWARLREVFHPRCRLMRTSVDEQARSAVRIMSVDEYVENVTPFLAETDFYEVEVANRMKLFGNIGQVWSTYQARHAPGDAVPERRGVNSIQVYRDRDGRWWVLSMLWDNERPGLTLPPG